MERTGSPELTLQQNAEQAFLQVNVEDLRSRQQDILNDGDLSDTERASQLDATIREYLGDHHIPDDNQNYEDYQSVLRSLSADRLSALQWRFGEWDEANQTNVGKTGFDRLHDEQERLFGRRLDLSTGDNQSTDRTSEEWDELAIDYEEYAGLLSDVHKSRENWARAASKRLGRAFSIKDSKRATLKEEYNTAVQSLGKLELRSVLEDDTVSVNDKKVEVLKYLFAEQKKLREQTLENLKGTKVSKFVEWMNRGKFATRVAKGIGIGVVAGVAGSVAAGAVGAGIVAAGAVGASRFVKGYASKDKHRGSKMPDKLDEVDSQNSDDTKIVLKHLAASDSSNILESASEKVNSFFEDDVKDEQKERRKSLAWGMGSIAVGAGAGYLLSNTSVLNDAKDAIHDKISSWVNGASGDGGKPQGTVTQPGESGGGGDGTPNHPDGGSNHHNVINLHEVSQDARWVDPGEGWYQTFNELGIPQDNWQDVLQDAGPKLHEQGWAYRMPDGQWGISQPGRLPDSALRVIAESSKDNGYKLVA